MDTVEISDVAGFALTLLPVTPLGEIIFCSFLFFSESSWFFFVAHGRGEGVRRANHWHDIFPATLEASSARSFYLGVNREVRRDRAMFLTNHFSHWLSFALCFCYLGAHARKRINSPRKTNYRNPPSLSKEFCFAKACQHLRKPNFFVSLLVRVPEGKITGLAFSQATLKATSVRSCYMGVIREVRRNLAIFLTNRLSRLRFLGFWITLR